MIAKLDQITIVQGCLRGLPIIDEEGVLSGQITESGRMIMKGQFGMGGSDLLIPCRIESHIAVVSGPETEGVCLKILGLTP